MMFIEFLLVRSYEKLLFTKNNAYLMNFLNICDLEYAYFKNRESILQYFIIID